jgi:hypothetical protein
MTRTTTTAALLVALVLTLPAGSEAQADAARLRADVEHLASDALAGRRAGTEGERLAAEHLAAELAALGAEPLPGQSDMFPGFAFTAGSRDAGSTLTVTRDGATARTFEGADVVQALAFSDDATVTGEVVFAGYGLVVPDAATLAYDSYAGLDVTDKVVVVLRYSPEDAEPDLRAMLARYSDLRYKALAARERGARALIVVTGPRSPNAGLTVPMGFDTALAGSGIPAASAAADVVDALFAGAPASLAEAQAALDGGDPHAAVGFALPGASVTLRTAVARERAQARNVVAYLPATGAVLPDKPWVLVGAHYDHLGEGAHASSLAGREETALVHYGADDNASGTAAVLEIGRLLAGGPRARHVILAFWSGEESGLLGSAAFVNDAVVPADALAASFNFDMVGRMQENRLVAQATGTSERWTGLLEQVNTLAGFDLRTQTDPYQPTDVATFNAAGVPSLSFTTGAHVDYHKPSDTADKIAYDDLARIAGMAAQLIRRTMDDADPPAYVRVDPPASRGSPGGVRITTGTIPEYASEAEGLLLGGVIAGGPAEAAGLARGDLIVQIGGQAILNVYDYTAALGFLRADEPVVVIYVRDGARRETTLTPAARR